MILGQCDSTSGMPHPDMPHPSYKWMTSDWYKNDPCKTLAEEPAFYGKDIVDRIVEYALKTQSSHDIACHSFSHQLFGDLGCSKVVAEAEVKRCLSLLRENYGIQARVFIFPRDSVGHLDMLRKEGFISFRGPISHSVNYSETDGGIASRKNISLALYLTFFYLTTPPPVVNPKMENGLVNILASLCYNKKPFIPLGLIVKKARKGIDRAIKEKKIFHLYTHLFNFGAAPKPKERARAMAMGKAIIATRVEGNKDVILDGKNGFLVPTQDPKAISFNVGKLLESAQLRKTTGQFNRETTVKEFRWEKTVSKIEQIYKNVVGEAHAIYGC